MTVGQAKGMVFNRTAERLKPPPSQSFGLRKSGLKFSYLSSGGHDRR